MKRILYNTASMTIGCIIGMFGMFLLFCWLVKTKEITYDNGYKDGRKQAQKECIQLIKNTKP